jgi:hypothetical protein
VFFNFIHFRKCPQCERSEPLFPNNLFLNKAGQAQNSEVGTKVGRSGVDELWIAAGVPRRMMCWARWYMLGGGCHPGLVYAEDRATTRVQLEKSGPKLVKSPSTRSRPDPILRVCALCGFSNAGRRAI